MNTIITSKDIKDAYSLMLFVEKTGEGEKMRKWVEELKRDIRKLLNEKSDRRLIHSDGIDGYILRIDVPDEIETMEEAEEWFDSTERLSYVDYGYDCTGQAFTSWHHIGILNGKLTCWHSISIDV